MSGRRHPFSGPLRFRSYRLDGLGAAGTRKTGRERLAEHIASATMI
jgi:hypothetical protein